MFKIVQIKDCIYGKVKKTSIEQWLNMLKTHYNIERGLGVFRGDYVLLEQTGLRYEQGQLVYSERIVYNLNLTTKLPARVNRTDEYADTWEGNYIHYDACKDRYVVQYIRYLYEDMLRVTNQLCEADMPIRGNSVQAPAETSQTQKYSASKTVCRKPVNDKPMVKRYPEGEYHKPWKKSHLDQLLNLYNKHLSQLEIAQNLKCREESVVYQLENYLDIENPFEFDASE